MSSKAGRMLLRDIVPRLYALIPRYAAPVGSEDLEELRQEAVTMAAQLLDRVGEERRY